MLLAELPDLVAQEMKGKTASATEKAQKQVASAIENARDYAQAVIDTLMKAKAA
jgi:chromosome partitioning protein